LFLIRLNKNKQKKTLTNC